MRKRALIVGIIVIANTIYGQTKDSAAVTLSFTVQQAIDYAMQNQNNVKNAQLDEESAQKKVNEIMGLGLPQINASFDIRDFLDVPTSLIPASAFGGPPGQYVAAKFGTQYQGTAGFDASQLLFSGDYFLGLKASKIYVDLSTKSMQRTKIETAAIVSKAYYMVLISKARLELMDANIKRVKTAMGGVEGMYRYGLAEKLDFDRLTVTYNTLLIEKETKIKY